MTFQSNGGLYFNSGNGASQTLNAPVPSDTWLHIVVTYSANRVKLYLNGELKGEYKVVSLNTLSNSSFRLGYNLHGHFDDLKIYNYALNATEITQLYKQTEVAEEVVNIPDANFKAALLAHTPAIDTNGDGKIQKSEATAFTGHINVSGKNIADLTGIEAFINATILDCSNNPLTTLDLSKNAALTQLFCNDAQLTTLNVANGNNTSFIQISAQNNSNLTCVQVDNTAYSTANWLAQPFRFDAGVGFSQNCAASTGIDNVKYNNITTVYPNPARYRLNIEVKEAANISIVNMLGAVVATHRLNSGNNTIDISTLTKGVYFIISSNDGVSKSSATVVKFIKE